VRRADLEHIIRATAQIADDDEVVIVGSQAILGQFPDAPPELLQSQDADVYPRNHPERADLVDGTIGELSPFHSTFGYYAHGVGPETAVLPDGWADAKTAVRHGMVDGPTLLRRLEATVLDPERRELTGARIRRDLAVPRGGRGRRPPPSP
jgi:hypothetical protein